MTYETLRVAAEKPIVFVGPSISVTDARKYLDADFRRPCRRGDLGAVDGQRTVGIIDGVFQQELAVSPREILQAIGRGVAVFGASSMGALRALEVPGMQGVGRVYEMYRNGLIDGDDEVALVFDPETSRPLTVPLVNVRYAVELLVRSGGIRAPIGERVLKAARALHFGERTYRHILAKAELINRADAGELESLLAGIDLKRDDAIALLDHLATVNRVSPVGATVEPRDRGSPKESLRSTTVGRRGVERLARTSPAADAPVHIWETGDSVPISELLGFLKVTGQFVAHAHNVLLRLLIRDDTKLFRRGESSMAGKRPRVKELLVAQFGAWGWRTAEEVRTSMSDLGLDAKSALKFLQAECQVAGALVGVGNTADPVVRRAWRAELFVNDLALKRETLVFASIKEATSKRLLTPSEEEMSWARDLMCRLHGTNRWPSVERALGTLGVSSLGVLEFLETLVEARRWVDRREQQSYGKKRERCSAKAILGPAPKAPGELRFSTPLQDAVNRLKQVKATVGITRVGMIEGLTDLRGVYVSQVARPNNSWSSTYGSGKSETPEGAVVGGIMEEVEKWAQEQYAGSPEWGTFDEVNRTRRTLDPALLALPHDSRYRPDLSISWQGAIDLFDGEGILVPLAAVATPAQAGPQNIFYSPRGGRVTMSTNGLASGFCLAEAVLHAACEVIERHATRMSELLVSNPGLRRAKMWPRRINIQTLGKPSMVLVESIAREGYETCLWDITSEIKVPTVYARVKRDQLVAPGWGAHPNPAVACHMAILEACQTIAGNVAGGREDLSVQARSLGRHDRPRPSRAADTAFWESDGEKAVAIASLGGIVTDDISDECEWISEQIEEAGISHLPVIDLSDERVAPVRVVRVVIPGVESNNPFHIGQCGRRALVSSLLLA